MRYKPAVVLVCAVFGAGCYRYVPTTFDALTPEMTVRARVAGETSLALSDILGRAPTVIEGEIVGNDAGGVLVAVPQLHAAHNSESTRVRQHVRLQETDVLQLDVRSLDRRRTGLWLGAVAGAVAYLLYRTVGPSADTEGEPPPSSQPNRVGPRHPLAR